MPCRKITFSNQEVYHLYNKTIDHRTIFVEQPLVHLFVDLIRYYQPKKHLLRYSHYQKLEPTTQDEYWQNRQAINNQQIELLAYVLMPNHFHLLVKQKLKNGVVQFISQVTNAFTRAYNCYHQRLGPIFLPRFKAKIILSREQLIHTSRYIHLNPYSSGIVKNINILKNYQSSSLPEYLIKPKICQTDLILSLFNLDASKYWEFLCNNAERQKSLEKIKHFGA
ncbi:hypothetical protein A2313_02620 [Candidatus Roizmanbacteria bacterium RIFOXYB2_FULL_41_10]|uniref:Transposase IS200-like domain-containing protein n=1 Tax=Candidatus Roizmanbacteria bacterium RIFOXYA1_FULL_41_12 TaxID=1802082 RepID=A0A1F7KEH6_9BACT|nr:MAG: hypothetical protein A2209_01395 [Candidatus Roizmanbacteria bacterium RIFOXYA1_FULL_41_12]OGK66721.1 MAG: hypothetical protein A2377_02320 [Candidatus Roizmanbacteria bacterium RIFOXYB1_FULL_41_27]OGK69057.1 MAG: hypothetical protein A2262_00810 [Candidatus Roizmanbacteria bacterium RIFOXYA2_FULL_41_8]OGK70633.1 MAG: hypothetical protein A2313_02620 [Candidatus Roizmanbacteria bacterium RIFOXYB2_FULL_41_10]OGK70905.1 MAG: hypothetical protein A2403_02390 [Candidatus Roizmanbacteria bac